MVGGPFLTALDSRAAVKGSRDPLGAQSIWVKFGGYVVGNLTTQSTLVSDFTLLLVGLYLAERAAEAEAAVGPLEVFLRWEQLVAYVRQRKGMRGFRGIDGAKRKLEESTRVTLSSAPQHQVLGDQRVYGVWGLYMVASRTSGLVVHGEHRLSPAGRALVEATFVPAMSRGNPKVLERLVRHLGRVEPWTIQLNNERELEASVARIVTDTLGKVERERYRHHLVHNESNDVTEGRQRELAALLLKHPDLELDPRGVRALAKEARALTGEKNALAVRLERIVACEAVLAPATNVFSWLLGQRGRKRDQILKDLGRLIGAGVKSIDADELGDLKDDIAAASGAEACQRWMTIGRGFATGDSGTVLDALLAHNREVMRERNGSSPWAELDGDELAVNFSEEASDLPTKSDLPALWEHPYFISSLRTVAEQVEAAA